MSDLVCHVYKLRDLYQKLDNLDWLSLSLPSCLRQLRDEAETLGPLGVDLVRKFEDYVLRGADKPTCPSVSGD